MTSEERFFAFRSERPPGCGLKTTQTLEGREARAGLTYLMAQVERDGTYAEAARNILRSFACPSEIPRNWNDVCGLPSEYWRVTQPLIN